MSLALYRKYRPGRFVDVIGQEHATEPLMRALNNDRLHHAYLFTGPRGCGKTSSARIMARSMNCEQGPTATPCEVCQSCIELAPNGTGSIDVIEIDAATYRGIEDAKELRERAVYAPVTSRYKVYIIDEAHQLTRDAFNVLLKLVEEPPPHLRFIFATTEPDKIIPTLRSRTHHYPFRLVSAKTLQEHMVKMCESEGIAADVAALALIARAGAGSVRDSQSVLGQIIAGAGPEGVTYADTVTQLGFTDEVLLSRVVVAIANADGAELFSLVDEVVSSGHEPRRFANDLLERLRDLVVVTQVPDSASSGLFDIPAEQIEDLEKQAKLFTSAQLVRVADLVSSGLSELRGAAAPRLQLELLAARLVIPAVSQDLEERIAKLEKGGPIASVRPSANRESTVTGESKLAQTLNETTKTPDSTQPVAPPPGRPVTVAPVKTVAPAPASKPAAAPPLKPSQVTSTPALVEADALPTAPKSAGELTIEQIKHAWPAVIANIQEQSKVSHMLIRDTSPLSIGSDGLLAVAFTNANNIQGATLGGHDLRLAAAVLEVLKAEVRIEFVLDGTRATVKEIIMEESTDSGHASPDDESIPERSAIDMVTNIMGGKIIGESSRE
jgi:DNA polymerase-3 subunit gamma/tau